MRNEAGTISDFGDPTRPDGAVGRAADLCSAGHVGEAGAVLAALLADEGSLGSLALAHARRVCGADEARLVQTLHNLALSFDQARRPAAADALWAEARLIAEQAN